MALVREALALHAEVPGPFEAARTQLVAATVLRRAGQRVAARAALEQASAAFETLGAIDLLRRADAELERFAARRSPDVLTRAERDVARLVVAGRTNKEIAGELHISLRTVESNLTRIYRKMDVRSRTELTAKLISAP